MITKATLYRELCLNINQFGQRDLLNTLFTTAGLSTTAGPMNLAMKAFVYDSPSASTNSIHVLFIGTGTTVWLPPYEWSKTELHKTKPVATLPQQNTTKAICGNNSWYICAVWAFYRLFTLWRQESLPFVLLYHQWRNRIITEVVSKFTGFSVIEMYLKFNGISSRA